MFKLVKFDFNKGQDAFIKIYGNKSVKIMQLTTM